jgi:hypothetical protein
MILNLVDEKNKDKLGFSYIDPLKLSLYAVGNFKSDKKRKIGHEITLQVSDIKKNYEKSLKMLDEVQAKIKDKKKKEEIRFIYDQHKKALRDNYPEERAVKFFFKIELFVYKKLSSNSIEKGSFIDEFKDVQEVLSIFKDFKTNVNGYICNTLAYSSKQYNLIGNIKFPYDLSKIPEIRVLPYADELIKTMGKPKLVRIGFEFEDSPIGLEELSLKFEDNNYIVPLAYKYNTDDLKDLIKRNYLQSLDIPKIFLRRKK